MASLLGVALLVLALPGPTMAFAPIGGGASTHESITKKALMEVVAETCRRVVEETGEVFNPTVSWKTNHAVKKQKIKSGKKKQLKYK